MRVDGQRHAPAAFPPSTHWVGGWVGPRAGLDRRGKSRLPPGFDPRTAQAVASRYTDWAVPAHRIATGSWWGLYGMTRNLDNFVGRRTREVELVRKVMHWLWNCSQVSRYTGGQLVKWVMAMHNIIGICRFRQSVTTSDRWPPYRRGQLYRFIGQVGAHVFPFTSSFHVFLFWRTQ